MMIDLNYSWSSTRDIESIGPYLDLQFLGKLGDRGRPVLGSRENSPKKVLPFHGDGLIEYTWFEAVVSGVLDKVKQV